MPATGVPALMKCGSKLELLLGARNRGEGRAGERGRGTGRVRWRVKLRSWVDRPVPPAWLFLAIEPWMLPRSLFLRLAASVGMRVDVHVIDSPSADQEVLLSCFTSSCGCLFSFWLPREVLKTPHLDAKDISCRLGFMEIRLISPSLQVKRPTLRHSTRAVLSSEVRALRLLVRG